LQSSCFFLDGGLQWILRWCYRLSVACSVIVVNRKKDMRTTSTATTAEVTNADFQNLAAAKAPEIGRPLFADTVVTQQGDKRGVGYVEAHERSAEEGGGVVVTPQHQEGDRRLSLIGMLQTVINNPAVRVAAAAGAFLLAEAKKSDGGFINDPASATASREAGAYATGIPDGTGRGGLLGLNMEDGTRYGSATYLDPWTVLTAGHVTWGYDDKITISTGNSLFTDPAVATVSQVIYFPTYAGPTGQFDVPDLAILKLSTPLGGDYVQNIATPVEREIVRGAGFGYFQTSTTDPVLNGQASAWDGRFLTNGSSANVSNQFYDALLDTLSVGSLRGFGLAIDSGGPAMLDRGLVGISVAANNAGTFILDLREPTVAAFISQHTGAPEGSVVVPTPPSLVLVGIGLGVIGVVGGSRRRQAESA
jgi:hypothetical protein